MLRHTHPTSLNRRYSLPSAVSIPRHIPKSAPPTPPKGIHYHNRSTASFPAADFVLLPLTPTSPSDAYTSLKDILRGIPSSILSPTPAVALAGTSPSSHVSGYEISIRHRLVKQAAWAYLQPAASSSPSSSSRRLYFSREFIRPMIEDSWRKMSVCLTRVYDWLVDALWLLFCR